jgi:PPOX class probable F420-dependent enzyme
MADRWVAGMTMATRAMSQMALLLRLPLWITHKEQVMTHVATSSATDEVVPELRPFVDQWAARLTTFKRDGQPAHTPVNVVVVEDRVLFRTYVKAWKCRRIERNPNVELAPSDIRGRMTGATIHGRAHRLEGTASEVAAAAIDAKYPFFQRRLIRLGHRLMRYRTVHYEIVPLREDGH